MIEITLPSGTITHMEHGVTGAQLFRGKQPGFTVHHNGKLAQFPEFLHVVLEDRDHIRCGFNPSAEITSGLRNEPRPRQDRPEFDETPAAEAALAALHRWQPPLVSNPPEPFFFTVPDEFHRPRDLAEYQRRQSEFKSFEDFLEHKRDLR